MRTSVIIVTHNSEKTLKRAVHCLENQTLSPTEILIVDSGSKRTDYLTPYKNVIKCENIGFCQANNLGFSRLNPSEFVFFVNPDLFLTPSYIEEACAFMQKNPQCTALTGALYREDHTLDSTGIFQTWYGRWYDRTTCQKKIEKIPAICGAAFFSRRDALSSLPYIFDPTFFMYKEDIDLSLRLRQQEGELFFLPHLSAIHCRGAKKRSSIPKVLRLQAAKNELKMHLNHRFLVPTFFSFFKYLCNRIP